MGKTPEVLWKVALSNGETHVEGVGLFETIEGQRAPWGRLLAYIRDTRATVTALSLWTKDGQTWNLPSRGKGSPRFGFFDGEKPIGFDLIPDALGHFSVVGGEGSTLDSIVPTDHFKVIEATYPNMGVEDTLIVRLSIWVDADDPRNSWSLVRLE